MTIYLDKTTIVPAVNLGYIIDPKRPILPYWDQVKDARCLAAHCHPRGQIIFSSRGITQVKTPLGVYLVPSSQAFWCPPEVEHELIFPGAVDIANLFIDPAWIHLLPSRQCVFNVSPLLKQLFLRAVRIGQDYLADSKEQRLMQVILDELASLTISPLALPWSVHPKINVILQRLFDEPTNNWQIEQWANYAHSTPRTLARLFKQEVNMTFGEWRMQVRLFYALEKLHLGQSVTEVGLALGYSSASSFITAFKKLMGQSPREYVSASLAG